MITGGLLLPFAARAGGQDRPDPLAKAVETELASIKAVHWSGATEPSDLVVSTCVEPFGRAWTDSLKVGETRDRSQRLRVDGERAYIRVADVETELKPGQAMHEREQYGLYGYLLKMLIWQKALEARPLPDPDRPWLDFHPALPPVVFFVRGRTVVRASYPVHKPKGAGMLDQQISFSGEVDSDGLHWPRKIEIARHRKPYFNLTINDFQIDRV